MSKPVLLKEKAVLKIVVSSFRFANYGLIKDEWGEVYGLLQGTIDDDYVIVTDAIPFTHTKHDESDLFLKVGFGPEDYVAAAELAEKIAPEFFVGWYHSHPGIDLFLSDFDNETQLGYQEQNPDAIALVEDPLLILKYPDLDNSMLENLDEKIFGFKIFRLKDISLGIESDFYEVNWKLDGDIINIRKKIDILIDKIPEHLPVRNVEDRYRKFIELNKKKIEQQFYSIHDYIKELKKKDKNRLKNYFIEQYEEFKKIKDRIEELIEDRLNLMEYLEYGEYYIREKYNKELNDFKNYLKELEDKLNKLKKNI